MDTLDVRTQEAIGAQWTYGDFLERLLEDEVERRGQKQLALRVRRAALNTAKTLETFDFAFNPNVNRQQLYDLAAGHFIHEKRNVLLCGPTGVGKSHLAQALAHEACRRGFDVVFIDAHKMLRHLASGRLDNTYERRLALYARADLLVTPALAPGASVDDFGLKPMQPPAAQDLYDVINERYEKGSVLLTSNRAPTEWANCRRCRSVGRPPVAHGGGQRWPGPALASGSRAHTCTHRRCGVITGASYRGKDRPVLGETGGARA